MRKIKSVCCMLPQGRDFCKVGETVNGAEVTAIVRRETNGGVTYRVMDKYMGFIKEYVNCPMIVDYAEEDEK